MNRVRSVVYVGNIVTLSEVCPRAEAVCVSGGRILCVGSRNDVMSYASGGDCELVELPAGVLYPGFIDTHSHLSAYSDTISQVFCGTVCGSVAGVLDALYRKAATVPADGWVLGYGYDDTGIPDKRHLTRQELDVICPDKPLIVKHISLHLGYANSAALRALGLSAATKMPGGEVVLDANGEPSGLLTENVAFDVFHRLPKLTLEQTHAHFLTAAAEYNRQGFTTVMDGGLGIFGDPTFFFQTYMALDREGRLPLRVWMQAVEPVIETWLSLGLYGGVGSDHVRFGGFKFYVDGSIQGFTAALLRDYHTRPGWRGGFVTSPEVTEQLILRFNELGIQIAVHTNGDAAIEAALQGFEKAWAHHPRPDVRHMLVHVQTASDAQLARMKAIGLIPTLFARHIEVWGDRHRDIFLGPERAARLDPAGSCVRLGLPFALHVDSPVLPPTALGSMHAAVNRVSDGGALLGPDQRITPLEALKAYTVNAALCCGGEHDRGRIEPGRYGDFVLLSDDLETIDPRAIRDVRVLMTVCGGDIVYQD